jgi:hypothetical protein
MSGVETQSIGRRSFPVKAGRRALGVAVLGLAMCEVDGRSDLNRMAARTRIATATRAPITAPD